MNFFRSIIEDSDPDEPETPQDPKSVSPPERNQDPDRVGQDWDPITPTPKTPDSASSNGGGGIGGGGWSFGGLIKTFATQSESVLETYRRDLREFGSGLRKESEIIREVASRAVKELPASLEAGASAAHGSLESVGQALDGVLKSTADVISQGNLISGSDGEPETPDTNKTVSSRRYSRFDAQLNVIQSDVNTFSKDPEDLEQYQKWKSEFKLDEKRDEVEELVGENGILDSFYKRLVASTVDEETFWCRYFYKVHKLKQQEKVRANLVKRAISVDDDEDLSWDVDDDDDNGWEQKNIAKTEDKAEKKNEASVDEASVDEKNLSHVDKLETSGNELQNKEEGDYAIVNVDTNDEKVKSEEIVEVVKSEEIVEVRNDEKVESKKVDEEKNDEKVKLNEKVDEESKGESETNNAGKESVVSSHQSSSEEDLDWDEIEDIEGHDEKKESNTHGGNPNRAELRNRLSVAKQDENLSWDIEDDDEPVRA